MKKIISFLTLFSMCMGLFSGCGNSASSVALNIPDDKYRTFYEVFVYSFYDSNEDGIGDLKEIGRASCRERV